MWWPHRWNAPVWRVCCHLSSFRCLDKSRNFPAPTIHLWKTNPGYPHFQHQRHLMWAQFLAFRHSWPCSRWHTAPLPPRQLILWGCCCQLLTWLLLHSTWVVWNGQKKRAKRKARVQKMKRKIKWDYKKGAGAWTLWGVQAEGRSNMTERGSRKDTVFTENLCVLEVMERMWPPVDPWAVREQSEAFPLPLSLAWALYPVPTAGAISRMQPWERKVLLTSPGQCMCDWTLLRPL